MIHDPETSAAVSLDSAIASAAECVFADYARNLCVDEQSAAVAEALDSLHGSIRRFETPAYVDGLVSLFYSVWYQPFQVNAAYSLMCRALDARRERLSAGRSLDIVDFGSGTLAFEFGLLLAVMGASRRDVPGLDIRVFLVEPSDAMTSTGFRIWERFAAIAGLDSDADSSSHSARLRVGSSTMQVKRVNETFEIEGPPAAERWLVAMHAYYARHRESIRRDLGLIHKALRPTLGLFTFHHANLDGIRYVSPFHARGVAAPIPALRLSGELHAVNAWRRRLAARLGRPDDPWLTRPVEWNPARGQRDNRAIWLCSG